MTGLDASMLYTETPTAHMHTMKIAVLDVSAEGGALDSGRLADEFAELSGAARDDAAEDAVAAVAAVPQA